MCVYSNVEIFVILGTFPKSLNFGMAFSMDNGKNEWIKRV